MKKVLFSVIFMVVAGLALSGCGGSSDTPMDEPAEDGNYHYTNRDFGFTIILPPEFEYYQTQRTEAEHYVDIEFFVPTADNQGHSAIAGYARPLTVRVFDEQAWEEEMDTGFYEKTGERGGRVYAIKFWDVIPDDWQDKWSEEMREDIINSFRLQ